MSFPLSRIGAPTGILGMPPVNPVGFVPNAGVTRSGGRSSPVGVGRAEFARASQAATPQGVRQAQLALPLGQRGAGAGSTLPSAFDKGDAFGLSEDSFERAGVSPSDALGLQVATQNASLKALTRSNVSAAQHRSSMNIISNIGR